MRPTGPRDGALGLLRRECCALGECFGTFFFGKPAGVNLRLFCETMSHKDLS